MSKFTAAFNAKMAIEAEVMLDYFDAKILFHDVHTPIMPRKAESPIKSGSPPFSFPYCPAIFPPTIPTRLNESLSQSPSDSRKLVSKCE